ncbi:LytTR family DNA-binding domain-containing protein [Tamlana sp. 2_MG-2023]|uniref:LytR/AlgR family response regulator transcription factor n=1 Tax=unclassified Tamlana TaxID=2614803 RepID=UPI0026E26AF0|nr:MULTISPECIES: LytTR family DNA-binding domain-containing protein [unclassified Tamlana]MDO6758899.1 LytTR family DNA-binding domain-containing protein [Tamlana sp. 2_MG-2023]MDO6789598.1 LytTR family DNA-binding domain-containing protein [Tamlana sp. 1_MG-2023]
MIKAIIVDDELNAIKSLQWEIENFCQGIEICDSFTDPIEAISAINYLKPDCVFLDIEMPEMDGFQLLQNLKYRNFDLIITTAFDNYAIKAFKESAIDYLLKPIDSDDLQNAVARIKVNKNKNLLGQELKSVLKNFMSNNSKIALPLAGKTIFINADDICYCKADGNYCEIYFKDDTSKMLSKKIKEVEELINSIAFFRVHNSYLVNLTHVKEFIKSDGQYLVLENGNSIPVARSKKETLLKRLSH